MLSAQNDRDQQEPVLPTQLLPETLTDVRFAPDPVLWNDPAVLEDMLSHEMYYAPDGTYFSSVQTSLQDWMRKTIVAWMKDVCDEQKFPIGLASAVQLLDRYLSQQNVKPDELQLLASGCLLVSGKIKAVNAIADWQLLQYTDNTITKEQLMLVEISIARTLNWDLSGVNVYDMAFTLARFLERDGILTSGIVEELLSQAMALLPAFLLDHEALQYRVSLLAAAAIKFITRTVMRCGYHSSCSVEACLLQMLQLKSNSSSWRSVVDYTDACLGDYVRQPTSAAGD